MSAQLGSNAATKEDYLHMLEQCAAFKAPLEQFFSEVMVNVDNAAVRQNRLALLQKVLDQLCKAADITAL